MYNIAFYALLCPNKVCARVGLNLGGVFAERRRVLAQPSFSESMGGIRAHPIHTITETYSLPSRNVHQADINRRKKNLVQHGFLLRSAVRLDELLLS